MAPLDDPRLDNPVYEALGGTQARFAVVRGRARRYEDDVAPFIAVPAAPSEQDWRDAADLVGPGGFAGVIHGGEIPGWKVVRTFVVAQMVGERVAGAPAPEALVLGSDDVPEMLALVAETEPGPFMNRTVELGTYLGIRHEGALVAMAGERMRFDGWTEISAVCTLPAHRGRGLAGRLTAALIDGIERRHERAFLHVLASNTAAIGLYERLGFRVRTTATMPLMTPDGGRV